MLSLVNIKYDIKSSYLIVSLCSVFLTGCSTAPREVSANIPLLEMENITKNVIVTDNHYWSLFENNATSTINFQQQNVQLGTPYKSALGLHCRSLHSASNVMDSTLSNRVVCRDAQAPNQKSDSSESPWYLSNALVDSYIQQPSQKNNDQLNGAQ
ncbi:hypothetical protein [uncultured Vibrio sp.]|uniref:hypothetical protein n=1 Tax=uncultured Vibrio sp. TaxID=114054 RepID=UPI000918E1BE|nr:hypothetical protein [uncultured Vibrio sp.]OIQ25363.1 MAG: hypothetical protein BM561_06255 [Vibrio sp. MedPE-SWchi]